MFATFGKVMMALAACALLVSVAAGCCYPCKAKVMKPACGCSAK